VSAPGSIGFFGAGVVGLRAARTVMAQGARRIVANDPRRIAEQQLVRAVGRLARSGDELEVLDCGVVIVAGGPRQLDQAIEVVRRGGACVTTTDDVTDTMKLIELHDSALVSGARLVVGATFMPGASGLIARMLADRLDFIDEIHVAVHGTGGPTCARQHHHALSGVAAGWHDGDWIERPSGSGRELCWFPDPVGPRDCYRAESPEVHLLHHSFPEVGRISARMSATRRDRLTARLPMLSPPHREGGLGGLRVEVRGSLDGERRAEVLGIAERAGQAAGVIAGTVAMALSDGLISAPGIHVLGDAHLPNELLIDRARAAGLTVHEYVGTY
jgi:hypothetical protein